MLMHAPSSGRTTDNGGRTDVGDSSAVQHDRNVSLKAGFLSRSTPARERKPSEVAASGNVRLSVYEHVVDGGYLRR